jgi:hypothetical protein
MRKFKVEFILNNHFKTEYVMASDSYDAGKIIKARYGNNVTIVSAYN